MLSRLWWFVAIPAGEIWWEALVLPKLDKSLTEKGQLWDQQFHSKLRDPVRTNEAASQSSPSQILDA